MHFSMCSCTSDPEVDPESGHHSTHPSYLAVTCSVSASPQENRIFWETTSWKCFRIQRSWSGYTLMRQPTVLGFFTHFSSCRQTPDLEVDSGVKLEGFFFSLKCDIFRTPSVGTSSPRESPRWPTVVGCRGLEVVGTTGV